MAKKLLYALFKILHITLLTVVFVTGNTAYAQTSLSSGDVVIVTVNTGSDSGIDIVPLVDIERGTKLILTNSEWDERSDSFVDEGFTFTYNADSFISKGTPIRLQGSFSLNDEFDQVLLYQEGENNSYQLLFGAFWNANPQRLLDPQRIFRRGKTQIIPNQLKDVDAYLTFTSKGNHQYFIRNGASGSKKMLLDFSTNVAYWRQHDSVPFPMLGTSFTLLTPPVIQFDESRTSVDERGRKITLNVAIYEHDGSDLTVAAVFDSISSTIDENELENETHRVIDFSGLEGNGVFEIEFPIINDEVFENTELGAFYLDSLSSGSYGDFRTHSAFVRDDDIPDLEIVELVSFPKPGALGDANRDGIRDILNDQYIIIQNKESIPVDLSDWKITSSRTRHTFEWEVTLQPDETITVFGGGDPDSALFVNQKVYVASSGGFSFSDGGGRVRLINEKGKSVAEYKYPAIEEDVLLSDPLVISSGSAIEVSGTSSTPTANITSQKIVLDGELNIPFPSSDGWSYLSAQALSYSPELQSRTFVWDEKAGSFIRSTNDGADLAQSYIIYLVGSDIEEEGAIKVKVEDFEEVETIRLTLSATDRDSDEKLTGTEGLNQFSNPLSKPIYVRSLMGLLKDRLLGDNTDIKVFTSTQSATGQVSHIELNEQSFIAPFASFWIKLDVTLASESVSLDVKTLLDVEAYESEEISEFEIEGTVELGLIANDSRKKFTIDFSRDEDPTFDLDLNGVSELSMNENKVLFFGKKENTPLSNLRIPSNFDAPIEIPIYMNVNEDCSCELRVENWDNIPLGARIKIRDVESGEEYELENDWRERFDVDRNDPLLTTESPDFQDVSRLKFVLRILPEGFIDLEDETEIPIELELYQNFPNPFNPTTTIRFFLPETNDVKLTIYNIVGQPIVVLAEGSFSQGEHERVWDASAFPSSIYISELVVGNRVLTRKMTLVK